MKILRDATEDEMVLAFLLMELKSKRFSDDILGKMSELGVNDSLVISGDLADEEQNKLRRKLLSAYRGYPDKELFANYPKNLSWKFAELEAGDIDKLRYIDYIYWNEISKNTSMPIEGAKTVLEGTLVFDVPNDNFFDALSALKNGNIFAPLILLTKDYEEFTILEGHVRATAYAMKQGSEAGGFAFVGESNVGE